jgi:hypothetical protein
MTSSNCFIRESVPVLPKTVWPYIRRRLSNIHIFEDILILFTKLYIFFEVKKCLVIKSVQHHALKDVKHIQHPVSGDIADGRVCYGKHALFRIHHFPACRQDFETTLKDIFIPYIFKFH